MRKLKLFLTLLMLMCIGVTQMWGEDQLYQGTVAKVDANGDQTMNGVAWTITSDNTSGLGQSVNATKGAQIGSGSKPTRSLTFETTGIAGTIKQVVVNTSGASGFSGTVSVTVGSTAFLCGSSETASLTTSAADYTFKGEATGKITIAWAQPSTSKAIYVKTIQVTYGEGSSCTNPVSVTKVTPVNGDFDISATEVCGDGDGGEVTISNIEPATGYTLDEVSVTVGTYSAVTGKVTGITANTSITVTFKALPKYTVSFNVGGSSATINPIEETSAGAGITLPAGPAPSCTDWAFAGWATATVASTTTAPTLLAAGANYKPAANCTLYAVYSKTEESGGGSVEEKSKKEGFETKEAGSNYQGTVTVNGSTESDCGIGWSIYYGCVSTNDKITGDKSAQMRWYSSAKTSIPYAKTTTAISGLQSVDFKARVSSTNIKISLWYSTDGENWTISDVNQETFAAASTAYDFSATISGEVGTDYYVKIGEDGGTAPSSSNVKLIIDEVQFNYKEGSGSSSTTYASVPDCSTPPAPACENTVSVTKVTPEHGAFEISATEVCGDGDGGEVTISNIEPATGYTLDEVSVTVGTYNESTGKVTGITNNTEITVTFKELPKYTVSFETGAGNPEQAAITEGSYGAGITLPEGPTPACSADGWIFAGWAEAAVASETTTAPTLLSGTYNPTADVTLHAVYKKTEGAVFDGTTEGDFAIYSIVGETKYYATAFAKKLGSTTNASEAVKFTFEKIVENEVTYFAIKSGNAYLSYKGSGTDFGFEGTEQYKWQPVEITGGWRLNSQTSGRAIIFSSTASPKVFGPYATSNLTNNSSDYHEIGLEGGTTYYLSAPACCEKRAITIANGIENGTVSVDLASACEGATVTLTFIPAGSHHLDSWSINGTAQDVAENTFTMPATAVTISATFEHDACQNLAAPTLDGEIAKTYNSATIAWNEVTGAVAYAISVVKDGETEPIFSDNVTELSKALADLEPETQYNYSIMAVGDGAEKCAEGNGVLEDNFITSALPEVQLTLMVAGVEDGRSAKHAILTPFNLPSTASVEDCLKEFVGWDRSSTCAVAPEFKPGEEMTFAANAEALTLYAVFADVKTPGVTSYVKTALADIASGSVVIITHDNGNLYAMSNDKGTSDAPTAVAVTDEAGVLTAGVADNILWTITKDGDNLSFAKGDDKLYCSSSNNSVRVGSGAANVFTIKDDYLHNTGNSAYVGVYNSADWRRYGTINSNIEGQTLAFYKKVTTAAEYENYSITCAATVADPVIAPEAGTYNEAQEITITCETEGATIYYTMDGKDPTNSSAVYDAENKPTVSESATVKAIAIKGALASEVVSAAYIFQVETPTISGATSFLGKATVTLNCATAGATIKYSIDGTDPSLIYSEPFDLEETATVKAIAVKENWTNSAVAEQAFTKVVPMTVTEARAAIDADEGTEGAYVTGIISQVDSYNKTYSSITYWISADGTSTNALKVYSGLGIDGANFSSKDDVTVGDSVVVKGDLLLYDESVYEMNYNNQLVSYVAKELSGIAVKTAPTKVIYKEDNHFDPAGLVITASYTVGQSQDIAYAGNESDFSFAPALTDALETTDEAVTITYGGKTTTQNITVNAKENFVVTITEPVNGTVVVKNGEDAIVSGVTEILEGTTLTIYATPAEDYAVDKIYVNGEVIEGNTFELSATTTVNVTFDVYATHTATWMVNGTSVKTQEAVTNTTLEFPTEVTPCTDMVLVGWLTSPLAEASETAPQGLITETAGLKMPKDGITYHAVFATASAAAEPWVINKDNFDKLTSGSGYAPYNGDHTLSDITYNTSNVMIQSQMIQFKSGQGVMYNKTAFSEDIVSIAINGINENITVYEGEEEISTGGTAVTLTDGVYPFSANMRYFRIKMGSATGQASSITVNLASTVSYSNYVTSCPSCTKVVTFAKAGEDENNTFELQVNSTAVASVETCDAAVDVNVVVTNHAENYVLSGVEVSGVEGATYNEGVISIPQNANGTLNVTVSFVENVPVTSISIKETTSIEIGATETLTVTFDPENATNKNVTWESSDESVATVENGVVTAVAVGEATITCKWAENAEIKDECVVTVTPHQVTPGTYGITLNNVLFGTGVNANITEEESGVANDVTIRIDGSGQTKPRTDATYVRFYNNSWMIMSVPAGYNITKIEYTYATSDTAIPEANVGEVNSSDKTWTGKAQSVTFSFSGKAFISTISVTYAADMKYAVTIANPEHGTITVMNGEDAVADGDEIGDGEILNVSGVSTNDAYRFGAISAYKTGDTETPVVISEGALTMPTFPITITASEKALYSVAVAVNDDEMGSATINDAASVYADETDDITLVATVNPGYEFVEWTVSNDNIILDDENAATTTAIAGAAGTITAIFQAQACTGLAAPTLNEVTKTYSSATIAWNAVTKDANNDDIDTEKLLGYVVNIKKGAEVVGTQDDITDATSYALSNLEANTTYSYSIMAMGDGTTYCEENNPLLEGNFTTNDYPAATLTLSEVGAENDYTWGSGLKLNSVIALPSSLQHSEGCSNKVLVGWSSEPIAEPSDKPEENYWEAGADYTMLSENDELYAVYATATPGTPCYSLSNAAPANSDNVIIARLVSEKYYALENAAGNSVATIELTVSAGVVSEPTDGVIWDVESATYGVYLRPTGETSSLHLNNSALKVAGGDTNGDLVFSANGNGSFKVARAANDRWISASGENGVSYTSTESSAAELYVFKYGAGAASYSGYTTACEVAVPQPSAVATPASVEATAAAVAETTIAIAYENVNLSGVTMNLYNNAACTEAYEGEWLTASLDDDKQVVYSIEANTSYNNAREAYIKVVAPQTDNLTDPAEVIIPVSQSKKAAEFASLEDLVAADVAANTNVTVSFENVVIKEIYMYNSNRRGLVFDIQKDEADIKIYFNADVPAAWVAGGKVSGTLTNCPWKTFSNTWQLAPASGWAWANLSYEAPATVSTVEITGGDPQKTYVDGEKFNPAGLHVLVTYTDQSTVVDPLGVTFSEATLAENQTSVEITATYNNVTSDPYTVEGLTVGPIQVKSIEDFIADEGGRCYLEGVVSNYTNTTKGYFDLTDASGTIYIYGCDAPSSFEEGDKIRVIAEVYELYNSKSEAKNVVYVTTLDQAVESVSLNVTEKTLFVGDNFALTATFTPAKATNKNVTWSTNAEGVATVENGVVTAIAAGEAIITVTTVDGEKTATCVVTVSEAERNTLTLIVNGGVYQSIKALVNASVWEILGSVTDPDIAGYNFKGWSLAEAEEVITEGTAGTLDADMTLYAVYAKGNVTYVKVTETSAITSGQYLIVYEGDNSHDAVAFNSALETLDAASNTIPVTINEGVINGNNSTNMAEFTIGSTGTIRSKSGYYIARTTNSNGMNVNATAEDGYTHTFSIDDSGNAVITSSGNPTLRYNYASDNLRFRYYKSGQQAIALYKRTDGAEGEPISTPTITVEENEVINISDVVSEGVPVSIVVENGGTVNIDQTTIASNVVVEDGGKINANAETTTPTIHFATTMGSTQTPGTASELGSVTNITLATGGEIIYDLTLGTSMAGIQADPSQWHAFTLPFAVSATEGIYDAETGEKLYNEVNYAIMDYHGDIRANGLYGWKKYSGILQPGVFYIMTVDGNTKTFRFKATQAGQMTQTTSMGYTAYNGSGDPSKDFGWNGIGNPSWVSGTVTVNVQVLDPYSYTYQPLTINTNITVSTPFFYNAGGDGSTGSVVMQSAGTGANYAPARTPANEIKNVAVTFGNEVFRDKLYISASEDALNEYEQDKDLVRMIMSNTPKVAQIFGNAYGMKLSMVNAPMANDQAEYSLTLYAPNAGEYTISAPEMEDADIFLTYEGSIIWNLSMSEYTNDFAKGNNEGYGLILVKKAPQVITGVDNAEANEAGVQKVIINDHVYILRAEQMYDVTGKMVK